MRIIELDDAELQGFKVWRYIRDLKHFQYLVEERKLWFSSVDVFRKDDPREGSFTKDYISRREAVWDKIKNPEAMRESVRQVMASMAERVFINCWSGKQDECALMWNAYAPETLAVQSTLPRLKAAVPDWITFALITYLDHDTAIVDSDHSLDWYLFKAKEFIGENEIRLICGNIPRGHPEHGRRIIPNGERQIEVDLEKLLVRVVVAPRSKYEDEVREILQNAKLNVPVERSVLTRTAYH
jgi:hypothetical protein